mmetsp:Transcript_39370/g.125610  ORF Transcript_39370/g.125610 Transcript_39370/m.125610 type:complete len:127 (-) Transcript_39370:379-759(-)
MSVETPLDMEIKDAVIRDTLAVVDPLDFDRVALLEVLQRRFGANGRGSDRRSGLYAGTKAEDREALNQDLNAVLKGQRPRQYGEMPANTGGFTRIAPSKQFDSIMKLKKVSPEHNIYGPKYMNMMS